MNVMQLLEKNQQVHFQILAVFFQNGSEVSYKKLAKTLSISAPTLQKELQNLHQNLAAFHEDAALIYSENDQVQLVLPLDFSLKQFFYAYLSEAIDFQILSYLFFHRDESTTKMMLELMLSEASLFRRFKAINQLLKEFDIQLKNKKLIGDEKQIRFFYYQFFSQSYLNEELIARLNAPAINNLIRVIEKQLQTTFSQAERWKVGLWLGIMEARFDYRGSQQHEASYPLLKSLENEAMFQLLRNILGRYLSRFAVSWSDYETVYFYLFLLAEGLIRPSLNDSLQKSLFFQEIDALNGELLQAIGDSERKTTETSTELRVFLTSVTIQALYIHGGIIAFAEFQPQSVANESLIEVAQQAIEQLEKNVNQSFSLEKKQHLTNELLLIRQWIQVKQEKAFTVGILLTQSRLRSGFLRRFLIKELAGYPNIHFDGTKEKDYDLLIVDHSEISEGYRYKKRLILTGGATPFEEERLHQIVDEIRNENLESELEKI
ncbi:helix-turn-helix domain-containing protein [Enterococcus casseliflavus]|uniref:helix-turn-helix domain-containing protein n=1 Tax=Enterococcus casseliflavus TaxID=37734 RepID=UPI001BCF407F|nr:helix-turn-helix domain-containing protein [Enterococcus casseliflavus]